MDTRQYEWSQVTLILDNDDIVGVRAIKYSEKMDKEYVRGKGNKPLDIKGGNISYEGEITILQSELEKLIAKGNGSVLGLRVDAVVSYGNPSKGDLLLADRIEDLEFTDNAKEMKQGDKFQEITLPFMCLNINYQI